MDSAAAEFHDWELLLRSDHPPPPPPAKPSDLGSDSEDGAIKSDYFALDSHNLYPKTDHGAPSPAGSDNPSWLDPESNSQYLGRPPRESPGLGFWSDESWDSQRSLLDSERGLEMGERVGNDREVEVESPKSVESEAGSGGGGEVKRMVWWKLPLEVMKLRAFKVRPVWSISIAAVAILGVFVLGKRLCRMKYKSRSIPLKISLDENKASQLKVQAARLNEVFSVVKRVPVTRPSLPAGGLTPWPVLGFI